MSKGKGDPKIGDKCGWLTVIGKPFIQDNEKYCDCRCRCGSVLTVKTRSLHGGWTSKRSCGCHLRNAKKNRIEEHKRFNVVHSEHKKVSKHKKHKLSERIESELEEFKKNGGEGIKL